MHLYSYVVRWDHGFAPNPFYNVCTLATCKPGIRKGAERGDYILGTGSAKHSLNGRAVFLMRVDEITTFDEYWRDPRFQRKIPVMNGSLRQRFGDNVYHRDTKTGAWLQADSRHSKINDRPNAKNLKRDTGRTDRVLLGFRFWYWGGDGPQIPKKFGKFVHQWPNYLKFASGKDVDDFLAWATAHNQQGDISDPFEWRFEKRWR